jgi:small redox-active disulfide protein 2
MDIKVLGPGCPKCLQTEKIVKGVVAEAGVEATLEKIPDIMQIMTFRVMSTPAVVVDGQVKSMGKIPKKEEILSWTEFWAFILWSTLSFLVGIFSKGYHSISFSQASIFSLMASRTARVFSTFSSRVPVKPEGSAKLQWRRVVIPGKKGHCSALDSSQTVITWVYNLPSLKRSKALLVLFWEISIPISFITSTANGFNVPGSNPALSASKRSPAISLSKASAI